MSNNKRYYGGLCLLVQKLIVKGVKIIKNTHPDIMWVKLDKVFFNFDRDLYICFCYISPSSSQVYKQQNITSETLFDTIQEDCANFKSRGNLMVMEDFNAWVSKNYIEGDNVLEFSSLPEGTYTPDTPLPRNTMELRENNKNGNCLINLCRTVSLRLLNGRSFGDSFGRFTRYPFERF